MTFEIGREVDGLGVCLTFVGVFSPLLARQARSALLLLPTFATLRYQIWSFTGCARHSFNGEHVRRMAARDLAFARRHPNQRIALVRRDGFFGGLDQVYHIQMDVLTTWKTASFHDVSFARTWAARDSSVDD